MTVQFSSLVSLPKKASNSSEDFKTVSHESAGSALNIDFRMHSSSIYSVLLGRAKTWLAENPGWKVI